MTPRLLPVLTAALVCTAALVGCGGGDSSNRAVSCSTPGVTADAINVGLLLPDSNVGSSSFVPARAGIDARLGAANKAGGVHGRRITYTWRDDQAKAATNAVMAQELVENVNVFGILETSVVASGSADYLSTHAIPVVGLGVEDVWARYRNMFTFSYIKGVSPSIGSFLRQRGGTRALVVAPTIGSAYTSANGADVQASLQTAGISSDLAVVDDTATPTQIAAVVDLLRRGNFDTLVGSISPDSFAQVVATAQDSGVAPRVIFANQAAVNSAQLAHFGTRLAGVMSAAAYVPPQLQSPATAAYRQAMVSYAPELQDADQTLALVGYIVADMFVRGLEAAGDCPTRQSFVDGLRSVRDYTAGGLVTPVDFAADFGRPADCFSFVAVNAQANGLTVLDPRYCGGTSRG
ncbi:ABC transporter substrate-binding protein [Frankia sp. R82]|uniref:ABC transporter substrate-binding protein n=1 Tax=Frankia sp. R82 TaxID=2950553 RepID=UPI002042F88B|nr:ABC transporter substrate-binding protein [Frankia sp. R82]MCM3885629.1 ABC transporter substrate-binding protein [Frankia sp. R82]